MFVNLNWLGSFDLRGERGMFNRQAYARRAAPGPMCL